MEAGNLYNIFKKIDLRYMTEMCPPAYFLLSTQLIIGVFSQTILSGIVIAKILRPKKRKQVNKIVVYF